jgi:hypothetical protein
MKEIYQILIQKIFAFVVSLEIPADVSKNTLKQLRCKNVRTFSASPPPPSVFR